VLFITLVNLLTGITTKRYYLWVLLNTIIYVDYKEYIFMQDNTYVVVDNMTKKILARIAVTIRPARPIKKENEIPPLIVSVPRIIANAANVQPKDQMMMYTDGERIYLDKIDEPKL
jgi:hypothetical protein